MSATTASPIRNKADKINTSVKYDDGVVSGRGSNRWQKYGHDRLYIGDGYVDLNEGKPVGDLGSDVPDVCDVEFELDQDSGKIEIVGYDYNDNALCSFGKIPKEIVVN